MGYPKRLLNPGEDLVFDLRPHWWFFSKHILTAIPLSVAVFFVLTMTPGAWKALARMVVVGVLLLWALWLVYIYFEWTYTHFVLTTDRLIFRRGIVAKSGIEIPLERINNVNFSQTIFERMIGAGDLFIESAGKDGHSAFQDVRSPNSVQQRILAQHELNVKKDASYTAAALQEAGFGGASGGAPKAASIPDQIKELASLKDLGILSEPEFEAKKRDLLDRM